MVQKLTAAAKLLNVESVEGGKRNLYSPNRNTREIAPWADQKIFCEGLL